MKQITITILFAIAALLLMAESENIAVLLISKASAFTIGYAAWHLCNRWNVLNGDTEV